MAAAQNGSSKNCSSEDDNSGKACYSFEVIDGKVRSSGIDGSSGDVAAVASMGAAAAREAAAPLAALA